MLFGSKNKPGYHGTGSALDERASSIASDARAATAARGTRAGAPAPGGAAAQEGQEQPEHQHSKRAWSPGARARRGATTREQPEHQHSQRILPCKSLMPLLARCAGSPGGWSWERFGRFPSRLGLNMFRKSKGHPAKVVRKS